MPGNLRESQVYPPNHRYPLKAQTITRVMVSEIRLPIPVAVIIAPVFALNVLRLLNERRDRRAQGSPVNMGASLSGCYSTINVPSIPALLCPGMAHQNGNLPALSATKVMLVVLPPPPVSVFASNCPTFRL